MEIVINSQKPFDIRKGNLPSISGLGRAIPVNISAVDTVKSSVAMRQSSLLLYIFMSKLLEQKTVTRYRKTNIEDCSERMKSTGRKYATETTKLPSILIAKPYSLH